MDSLSPESRALYEILTADTTELYESKFAAYKKARLDAVKQFVNDTRTQLFPDHAEAAPEVSTLLQDPTALDVVPVAVDFNASDLTAPTPTTCSTECPNNDNSASVRAVISSATPSSSTSTGHVVLKLAADVVCDRDEALPVDATCDVALPPTNCPTGLSGSDFGMPFLASVVPHATLLKPLPTAAAALGPAFTVQVQMSSSTSDLATIGMDDNLATKVFWVRNNIISTNPVHSEALIVKEQEKVLQPIPWPSFKYHSYRVYLQEPRSSTWQWEHMQQWRPPEGAYSWICMTGQRAIVPWPPPSCTCARTPLIRGYNLFYHAQRKRGRELLAVCVLQSPLLPPLQVVEESQGKWDARWLDVREDRHLFERIKIMKLKPPWPHFLGMCMNQPLDSSEDEIRLKCKGREHCLIGEILLEVISSKEEIQPTCQVWTILPNDLNGGFSFDNLWDPGGLISGDWHFQHLEESRRHKRSVSVALYGQQAIELFPRNEPGYACAPFEHSIDKVMEMFASPTITCELHYSTLVAESLLSAPYSSWCMRCVKLDMEGPWQCVSFLQPKPPWSNLAEWHRQNLEYNGLTCQYGSFFRFKDCWSDMHCAQSTITFSAEQGHPSSNGFFLILNGEAIIQQHYICARVLAVAAFNVWIFHHILRGNSHYSKLMHWTFSHSLLHSEFLFYTPGYIIFFWCALVQWKIPWTITLVSLRSWCQSYRPGANLTVLGLIPYTIARILGMYPHPEFRFHMLVQSPGDLGERPKETWNHILIRVSELMVSWLRLPPDGAKLSGKLFLFIEGAQVDEKSLGYLIHCGSETIQWEIAWTLWYECDFLVQPDMLQIDMLQIDLQICILVLVEHLYNFSGLSCCCEPWTSWQLQFFISGTRIASSIYAQLICLRARDELDMRTELSMQTDIFALNCCSIFLAALHNMSACSSLQIIQCPWFLVSYIHPSAPLYLGADSFLFQLTIAVVHMESCCDEIS